MSEMQEVIEKARTLGEAIAAHPRVREFVAARKAVEHDAAAQALLREYSRQARVIQDLERQGRPVEVVEKQRLADVESQMSANDPLRNFMRIQADYLELMQRINQAMDEPLAEVHPGGAAP